MSLQGLLEMSRQSFRGLDAAMNTTGQNVANANTEGYSRRRVVMAATGTATAGLYTQPTGVHATGSGVSLESYERMRDALVQRAGWQVRSDAGAAEEEHRILTTLEALFPMDGAGALSDVLDQFWGAWSDLADNPTDRGVRLVVRSRAETLATTFQRLDTEVGRLEGETLSALSAGVGDVNDKLAQIGVLNDEIAQARFRGAADPEAEDRRDELISELAEYVPLRATHEDSGAVAIHINGMSVVDGATVNGLSLDTSGDLPRVVFGKSDVALPVPAQGGGKMGAWMRVLGQTLPDTLAKLDALAGTLVEKVNAVHEKGFNLHGADNYAFFDRSGTTAATIALDPFIEQDPLNIAASYGQPVSGYGDSGAALDVVALRTEPLLGGKQETAETFAINLVTGIGADVRQAASLYERGAALGNHLEAIERGVSGVSLEEEMTHLIEYQHSFQASARVLSTVQTMLDTLIAM